MTKRSSSDCNLSHSRQYVLKKFLQKDLKLFEKFKEMIRSKILSKISGKSFN